jgi:hypothetical protein
MRISDRSIVYTVAIIIVGLSWLSCINSIIDSSKTSRRNKGTPSNAEAHSKKGDDVMTLENEHYYYEMGAIELAKLSKNITDVHIGDLRSDVKKLLGAPTDETKLAPKSNNTDWFEWEIVYYTKIWEKGLVNEKYDKKVSLYFDKNDRLLKVISNVNSISSRK